VIRFNTPWRRAGLTVAFLLLASTAAQAQFRAPYVGAAVGDTDFGTGIRLYGGGRFTDIVGLEGHLTSYGSRTVRPGGSLSCKDSAWATGASATGTLPLTTSFSAFGKAGLHYLKTRVSGPCSGGDGQLELGIGAGVLWQFSPKAALRVEFENIGGTNGDFISVGVQFPL
jgi:Outer membrane protein beta-barrel domain